MAQKKKIVKPSNPAITVLFGEDDFQVHERAKTIFADWKSRFPDSDQEIIDGTAAVTSEAIAVINQVQEALDTLPFFGSMKLVWLKSCNFLGDERTASSQAVTERLRTFLNTLEVLNPAKSLFLLSAGKIDKRKVFYKTLGSLATMEHFEGLSLSDKNWAYEAERMMRGFFQGKGQVIQDDALYEFIQAVGPHVRNLNMEGEKVSLYAGSKAPIQLRHVREVVVYQKQARAFALTEALGERNSAAILNTLDEELWSMRTDRSKSVIGLLYGIITRVRSILLVRGLIDQGWIKQARDYNSFKSQLSRIPEGLMPEDKKFNPLLSNPFMLFKSAQHAFNYKTEELVEAMKLLLDCNLKLVSSSVDEGQLLQQTLLNIAGKEIPNS